ncbi:4-hydroxy-tetrahydrodipicolinate synthase [Thiohalophilus sp.]|uniref:4-hydroxy-tetrahydrodipicolinate synthase n=1 Tax=Thiohalophilus sp. TaxID=3028392 RepID=UPI002ACDD92E|nr:4-hydroxy-tetrahydrodipicolinate synthase [Thiohalophilus sp.]MDZ7662374.1 4-hydroxy-tetrahydrodipicolinate synthase [Thiohalophilus sp.]
MFQGSMVALATPMHEDGSLDEAALAALVAFHVENQTDAIVAVGTTGESATLDEQEHCHVVKRVVELSRGRIPVIAGTGSNSTREAITLTRCAREVGADACLLVTPYYNKPTQEGLYQHFKAVAGAVDIPQILYNVPGRTAVDMLPETVARLAAIENIIGIKDATADVQRARDIIALCGPQFEVYSGDDGTAMELMLAGAHGDISVTANVAPKMMHEMCMAAIAGDRESATRLNDQLMGLHKNLFLEANPIPVKWALYDMGLIPAGIRLPLTVLSSEYQTIVHDELRKLGLVQ